MKSMYGILWIGVSLVHSVHADVLSEQQQLMQKLMDCIKISAQKQFDFADDAISRNVTLTEFYDGLHRLDPNYSFGESSQECRGISERLRDLLMDEEAAQRKAVVHKPQQSEQSEKPVEQKSAPEGESVGSAS